MSNIEQPTIVPSGAGRQAKAPAKAKDAAKQAAFVANAGRLEEPMPGTYPVLTMVGALAELLPVDFEIGLQSYVDGIVQIWNVGCDDPNFDKLLHHRTLGQAQRETFKNAITASYYRASLVGLAQSIIGAHQSLFLTRGDTSAISGPSLPLPIPTRMLASAFGEFRVPALGRKYVFSDFHRVIRRLMRAANSVRNGNADYAMPVFLFPCDDADRSLDWMLVDGAQRLLAVHPTRPIHIPNLEIFQNAIPEVVTTIHEAEPYPQATWAALQFVFGNRPAGVNNWRVASVDTLRTASTGVTAPAGMPAGEQDYTTPTQMKVFATESVDSWNKYSELVSSWWKLADNKEMGERAGSASQTYKVNWESNVVQASGLIYPGSKDMALAVVLPTTWAWSSTRPLDPNKLDDYRIVSTASRSTLLTQWVSHGLAPPQAVP